jgi:MFS family permease
MVLDFTEREERVKEMGRYSVSWGSAFLIGPFIGGLIIQNFGFFTLFVTSCVLSAGSLLGAIGLIYGGILEAHIDNVPEVKELFHGVRRLLPWFGLLVCYGLIFSVVTTILPGYANAIGINAVLVGVLFTGFGLARVVSYTGSERYRRFGERRALGLASFLLALGCILIVLLPSFPIFLIAVPLMGGCVAIVFPLSIGLISRHFPESELGGAVGLYESTYGVGTAIGPVLAGVLATVLDVRLSFLGAAAAGVVMIIIAARAKTYEN